MRCSRLMLLAGMAFVSGLASIVGATTVNLGMHAGKTYVYQDTPQTYAVARAEAVGLGGYLVSINDAAEQAWLETALAPIVPGEPRVSYIGLWNDGTFNWQWESGEALTYTNWRQFGEGGYLFPEPTQTPGEFVAVMYTNNPPIPLGRWADTFDSDLWPAIYELNPTGVIPEPVTMAGVFLGIAGVARYVRKRRTA